MKIFKSKQYLYFWALLLFFALISCEKDEQIPSIEEFNKPLTELNLSYGKDGVQKMDIYLPAGRNPNYTQVLLLIHGGAWITGAKEDMNAIIPQLQQTFGNEYAVANMNYRLVNIFGTQYMLPTQTDDIENAMNFIEKNAQKWGIKPKFVPVGVSAGGHLSMLYAYYFDSKKRVKAVVNVVGPTDLSDPFYLNDPLFSLGFNYISKSKDIPDGMTATQYASPITWIDAQAPPTISFYGNKDHLIPNNQGEKLENKLIQHKVVYEMYTFDGGHDIGEKFTDDIVSKSKSFLDGVN